MMGDNTLARWVLGSSLLLGGVNGASAQQCQANITASTPTQRFSDHGNGTLTDQQTGLMWRKCLEGQDGDGCYGNAVPFQWGQVSQQASTLNSHRFAGYADWRVPTDRELASISEKQCQSPAVNLKVFPRMLPISLWSSVADGANAWGFDFNRGQIYRSYKGGGKYLRLVRNSR